MNRIFLTGLFAFFGLFVFAKKEVGKTASENPKSETQNPKSPAPPDSLSNVEAFLAAQKIEAQKTRDGLFYRIENAGNGPAPKPGDYVKVHYTGRLLNGKIFDATRSEKKDEPFVFQFGFRQVVPGMDIGVGLLRAGGKAEFFVPNRLAYGNVAVGSVIPSGAALIFEVELLEIMTPASYESYIADLEEREKIEFEKQKKTQAEADQKLLDAYEKTKNLKAEKMPSGLRVIVEKAGNGPKPKAGQTLEVEYEGFLLSGERFDGSAEAKPFSFEIGSGKVIAGWEEGLLKFGAGGEGWLLIPSGLAYGPLSIEEGAVKIPANSCLVFRTKLVSIQ